MNGEGFLQELENAIDYANSEEYIVRVSSDSGTGNIIAGGGDNKMKVSDVLTISFSKAQEYKFIEWCAVQKDDESVSMNEYVEFGDNKSVETTVKLVKTPEKVLLIKPVCEKTLSVIEKFPADSPEGVERDSTIIFTFSSPLSEKNDLSRIKIEVSGSTTEGNKNFSTPIIQDNKLIIMADMENRIYVAAGTTKVVTVTIPKDFIYVSSSGDLEIGEEIIHKYTINSSTCDKTDISYKTSIEESGVLKVDGKSDIVDLQKYSIGHEVDVTFKPAAGYKFLGWECNNSNAVRMQYPTDEGYDENGFNEASSTASVKVTVISAQKDVVVTAKVFKIPSNKIRITSDYGKISPNNEQEYKEGDEVQLMFTADSGYQFIRWRVVDINTQKEIENQDFVTFNPADESNTSFTFNKASTEHALLIEPYCEKRPTVVFTVPQNGEKNVVRNRTIRIFFSKDIKLDSLLENIDIYEGFQRIVGDELVFDKTSVKNKVNIKLGSSEGTLFGKTLYITLKEDELFSPSSYMNVVIKKDVQDLTGSSLESEFTLQFQTSNYVDSLAPVIKEVCAGLNDSWEDIKVFNQDDEISNVYDPKTNLMPSIYHDQVNFYVDASDISGAGNDVSGASDESAVVNICYRITRYTMDNEQNIIKDNTFSTEEFSTPYISKQYSQESMKVAEKDFTALTGKKSGCVVTYDLTDYKDGLYRFDICAEDGTENKGFTENNWKTHKNGYKSFFVLKDTAPVICESLNWIDNTGEIDSDFMFRETEDPYKDFGKILKLKYAHSLLGLKDVIFNVNNSIEVLKGSGIKVRYCKEDNYQSAEEIDIDVNDSKIVLKPENLGESFNFAEEGYLFIEGLSFGTKNGTVSIDVSLTNGEKESEKNKIQALNDQMPPRFYREVDGVKNDEGPLAASYTYNKGDATEHVWPRPGNPGVLSKEFWDSPNIKNKDGNPVRWFYTNATVSSGIYGIALALNFEDEHDIQWYYKQNHTSLMSDEDLGKLSILPEGDGVNEGGIINAKNGVVTKTFTEGTWSICMKDKAGNCSKTYTFVVIKDHTRPSDKLDDGGDMRLAMTVGNLGKASIGNNGTSCEDKWRITDANAYNYYEFFSKSHDTQWMSISSIYIKGKAEDVHKATLDISLTGKATGKNYCGYNVSTNKYSECKPSRTSSGIAQYCLNWKWLDYNTNKGDPFVPAYPTEIDTSVVDYDPVYGGADYIHSDYINKDYPNTLVKWEDYTAGNDISWQLYHKWGNRDDYGYLPPLTLFLKDGCGNINWVRIDNIAANSTLWNYMWQFQYN